MKKKTSKTIAPQTYDKGRKQDSSAIPNITNINSAHNGLSPEMAFLLSHTEECFVCVDMNLNIILFNDRFVSQYQTYLHRIPEKGASILDYVHPDRKEIVRQLYQKVFQGETVTSEIEIQAADHSVHIFHNKFKPLRNTANQIVGGFVITNDITEYRLTEKQLREERLRLRTLIDNLPLTVYTKDLQSRKTMSNRYDYEYSGFSSEEEVLGKNDFELFSEESARNTIEEDQVIFKTGTSIIAKEEHHIKKDGSDIWFLISKIPLKDEKENITGLLGISFDISERKKAEQALKDSEEKRELIMNAALDAIICIDIEGKITFWNPQAEKIFGWKGSEVLHRKLSETIIPPAFREMHEQGMESYRQKGTGTILNRLLELHAITKEGKEFPVELSIMPIKQGEEEFFCAFIRDIQKRKKREETLKNSEKQLSISMKIARLGYWEFDVAENLFTFNDQFFSMMKTSVVKTGGYRMAPQEYAEMFVHPDDQHLVSTEVGKALTAVSPDFNSYLEHRVIFGNGEKGYISVNFFIVKDEKGNTIKTFGVNQDITERKKAEEDIRIANERYELIARVTNDAIYEWDIVNNVNYWGEGYETLFGHKRTGDRMPPESWVDNLHPDEKEQLFAAAYYAFENKLQSLTRELRFRCADGSFKTVFDKLVILYDNNEKPLKIIGAMQDITELKKNESAVIKLNEQLNKRAEELADSNAELQQFAYIASHDLQEPLRMVSSFLQLLQKKYQGKLDETADQYIHFAVDGAERMKKLIFDLLEYSRVGTNREILTDTNLNEIVSNVLMVFAEKIEKSKACVVIRKLPIVRAHKTQLSQLFQNLIGNALKYNNSPVPKIEIGYEEKKEAWQFYIKDNGIGIDQKFFDKVFIIFQRLHNKNEFSGTGIGLAICKKIVERHGGSIWIESEPGKGSTFFFTIKK